MRARILDLTLGAILYIDENDSAEYASSTVLAAAHFNVGASRLFPPRAVWNRSSARLYAHPFVASDAYLSIQITQYTLFKQLHTTANKIPSKIHHRRFTGVLLNLTSSGLLRMLIMVASGA
jgi:hypothetical protein